MYILYFIYTMDVNYHNIIYQINNIDDNSDKNYLDS